MTHYDFDDGTVIDTMLKTSLLIRHNINIVKLIIMYYRKCFTVEILKPIRIGSC